MLSMLPDLFHSMDWISRTYTVQMDCVEKGLKTTPKLARAERCRYAGPDF